MNSESPEAGAPQTVLFALIKDRLNRAPFVPFRIVTTSGRAYEVPTADHAVVFPKLRVVYIADDSDGGVEIHTLPVSAIESLRPRPRKRAA
ncbi:MAG: hypothetical protein EXS37_04645 [Opitutus sp.]|nr:hypothetical protein [Opitutus sp.]